MTATIPLTRGYEALVDDIDADLGNLRWHALVKGNTVYAARNKKRPGVLHLHRIVLERVLARPLNDTEMVDHINGNGLDNRRVNLRLATHSENLRNQRRSRDNTSGVKGVTWHKRYGKWYAQICCNGRRHSLGYFTSLEDATRAYETAALNLFGEFASKGAPNVAL